MEHGLPVLLDRQPGIGIGHQGDIHRLECLRHQLHQGVRTLAAVEPHRRNPQGFCHHQGRGHIRPVQQLPILIKGKGAHNGQVCIFLGCQDGRFGFVTVAHGFDQDQVRSRSGSCLHLGGVQSHRLCKGQVPERLEQFPGGAQIQGHKSVPDFCSKRRPGIFHPGPDQFFHFRLAVGCPELQPVGSEGIGFQDIHSGPYIGLVDGPDLLRMEQVPGFRQFSRLQAGFLEHGPHGSVKEQPSGMQSFCKIHDSS